MNQSVSNPVEEHPPYAAGERAARARLWKLVSGEFPWQRCDRRRWRLVYGWSAAAAAVLLVAAGTWAFRGRDDTAQAIPPGPGPYISDDKTFLDPSPVNTAVSFDDLVLRWNATLGTDQLFQITLFGEVEGERVPILEDTTDQPVYRPDPAALAGQDQVFWQVRIFEDLLGQSPDDAVSPMYQIRRQ